MTTTKTPTMMEISRKIRQQRLNRRRLMMGAAGTAGAAGLASLGLPSRARAQDTINLII